MQFETTCQSAVQHGASDLILHCGEIPRMRVGGVMCMVPGAVAIDDAFLSTLWSAAKVDPATENADAALVLPDGQRFRASLFQHLGQRAAVLRVVRRDIPSLDTLGLPVELLRDWLGRRAGLVLVTGPTNSGKSTTLAACIAETAHAAPRHIITVEDPVEFVFANGDSIISQREVGIDTPSFSHALHQALRQSPDVILIGEIRDAESAVTALQATETGHLVLASVHGSRASDAIERLTQLLPADLRPMLARVLAANLIGVIAQRLLPTTSGERIASVEYFTNVGATRSLVEQCRLDELNQLIERSAPDTARSQNQSLLQLCRASQISETEALAASDSRSDLMLQLKGINRRTN
ncbi:MAG: type IV pilus twitching motility protein PilT [Chthoniobacterales bacterium]